MLCSAQRTVGAQWGVNSQRRAHFHVARDHRQERYRLSFEHCEALLLATLQLHEAHAAHTKKTHRQPQLTDACGLPTTGLTSTWLRLTTRRTLRWASRKFSASHTALIVKSIFPDALSRCHFPAPAVGLLSELRLNLFLSAVILL